MSLSVSDRAESGKADGVAVSFPPSFGRVAAAPRWRLPRPFALRQPRSPPSRYSDGFAHAAGPLGRVRRAQRFLVEEVSLVKASEKPDSVFQKLVKAAQRYGKVFEPKDPKPPAPGTTTEAQRLREQFEAADVALRDNLIELAGQVAAASNALHAKLGARLRALEKERADSERRRKGLAEAAEVVNYDWRIKHRQDRDSIGPFTIEHKPQSSVIKLGAFKLGSRSFPSGSELFEAVKAERERLENAAKDVWPEMKAKLVPLQQGPDKTVSWPRVAAALGSEKVPFKKLEAAVIFALAWLRVGGLDPGWVVSTRPPTLAQQGKKYSVVLPRIDRPGDPEKISAIRLDPPTGA